MGDRNDILHVKSHAAKTHCRERMI